MNQILGIQRAAAHITLIPASSFVAAVGAGALNIPVRQEPLATGAVGQLHNLGVDIAPVFKFRKYLVDRFLVVFGMGVSKKIEGDSQFLPGIQELGMVPVEDLLGSNAFLVGTNRNRRSVSVAAGNH